MHVMSPAPYSIVNADWRSLEKDFSHYRKTVHSGPEVKHAGLKIIYTYHDPVVRALSHLCPVLQVPTSLVYRNPGVRAILRRWNPGLAVHANRRCFSVSRAPNEITNLW